MPNRLLLGFLAVLGFLGGCSSAPMRSDLLTVAESSEWQATGRHSQVVEFVNALAAHSDCVRVVEMGKSAEGRSIPLVILADPMVASAAEARASGKMVVYAQGGIHSGECCGKEALQMLAREIAASKRHPYLKEFVILLAPIYNPDGNERVSVDNRPGQLGPKEGMGQRATAEGYDLNRDNTKLDSPEARALSRLLNEWDPLLVIDTHTTNGSFHQNTLTFDGPVHPAGDPAIVNFVREVYLPTVSEALQLRTGYKTTFYGNYNRARTKWTTYDGRPRFGTRARGLRGIVSILTEAYKYASYKDRVLCTKAFCEELLTYAMNHRATFQEIVRQVRERTIEKGRVASESDRVAIQSKVARLPRDILIHGWVETESDARKRSVPTDVKHTYTMEHWGAYEPSLEVVRPVAYAYPARLSSLTEKLKQHGVVMRQVAALREGDLEVYRVESIMRQSRKYQNHNQVQLKVSVTRSRGKIAAGMMVVSTAQPLGNLVVYLLEPLAADGLTAWNVLDDAIEVGEDFPVSRIMRWLN